MCLDDIAQAEEEHLVGFLEAGGEVAGRTGGILEPFE
jgi:hypothetical protein